MIKYTEDRYSGATIDTAHINLTQSRFAIELKEIINSLTDKNLLWINIPIEKSYFICVLTKLGFEFHHCDNRSLMMVKKLIVNSLIPTTKNFIVGVGAIVIHKNKLLVVKENFSNDYKIPGGHIDKRETIKNALIREVFEETGINIEFESIMNVGHFPNGQFGESNIYMVCTAKALSDRINIKDTSEIIEAKWMDILDYIHSGNVNIYNKSVVNAVINNQFSKFKEQNIKLKVSGGEIYY